MKYAPRRSPRSGNTIIQKKNKSPFFSCKQPTIQTKLRIGKPGDKFEKEADNMADKVMSMPQSSDSIQRMPKRGEEEIQKKSLLASITPLIQKQSMGEEEESLQMQPIEEEEEMLQMQAEEEEEEMLQLQAEEEEEEMLQMQSEEEEEAIQAKSNSGKAIAPNPIASQLHSSKGNGSNLPDSTNQFMSNAFGTDFSQVRIHTGSAAVQMNQNLKARAFTNGRDIYFNKGQFNPDTKAGKKLLAHELTHVVQQGKNKIGPSIQRYTVPGKTKCRNLVSWLNTNSPYAPKWAATKVDLESDPPNFGNVMTKKVRGGVKAEVRGNPKTIVKMTAPIDMPTWTPPKGANQKAELKAWNKMIVALNKHEKEHRRIGKTWQGILQNKMRTLHFIVKGKNHDDAMSKASLKLSRKEAQWQKDAQAAQDSFDKKSKHGKKAIKGFPEVKLNCP